MAESRKRTGPGRRFVKGVSGNPGGRPKVVAEVTQWARELCEKEGRKALQALAQSKDRRISLEAWKVILDRAYGKPAQQLQHTGVDGGVLRIEVVYVSKVNGHE